MTATFRRPENAAAGVFAGWHSEDGRTIIRRQP